jgi:large conductance mechanosensitive channel
MLNEFKSFIARGNVIDLAVGIIMGAAFTAIVDSLVKDIIMAMLGGILAGVDFSHIVITIGGAKIGIGLFINAVIKFLIVAWAVFLLVKAVNKFMLTKQATPAAPPADVVLLTEIRDILGKR